MVAPSRPPVIGLTTYGCRQTGQYALFETYLVAIRQAGGLPILLPPGDQSLNHLLALVDGLVLTGGGDINPACYGGADHPTIYKVDDQRDEFELGLARLALDSHLPVLGICRGLQVLSLASGGEPLYPHLPEVFGSHTRHRTADAQPTCHQVTIQPNTHLSQALQQSELSVVSWHHQAIPAVPPHWKVAAVAPDGLVEAIEHMRHPWAVALQWHPEMSLQDGYQPLIFKAFIAAARAQQQPLSEPAKGLGDRPTGPAHHASPLAMRK